MEATAEMVRASDAPGSEAMRQRIYDTEEKILVTLIQRNSATQLRVYALRMVARPEAARRDYPTEYVHINVGRWFKDHEKERWRPDNCPWKGGPLIFPSEVPLVIKAMNRGLELARARRWRVE